MFDAVAYADAVLPPTWRAKASIRATMFREQIALYDDPNQFKESHAGRRAGKSDGMPKSTCLDALDAGENEAVLIIAETLKKCRQLHWANLQAQVVKHRLPFVPDGQESSWTNPNGGKIIFWGLPDRASIELLRGFKVLSARVDESASLAPMLPRLVTDVLEPALGDTGGSLTLYGTPSVTRAGPWFDICEGSEAHKWSHHHWDVRNNPHFRSSKGGGAKWLESVLARNNWDWSHPTFRREYLGLFVDDTNRMVVEYLRTRNRVDSLPVDYNPDTWPKVAGIDYGYNDSFAIVVIVFDPHTAKKYVVHAEKKSKLTYDAAAEMLRTVLTQHRCTRVACDPAGGGKPFYETFNNKYGGELGVNLVSAHKVAGSLAESIRFQNTELRCERLFVVTPAAEPLALEWQVLPWKDDLRTKVDDAFAQDLFDAGRYALMEMLPWQAKPRPPQETPGERLQRELLEQSQRQAQRHTDPINSLLERW